MENAKTISNNFLNLLLVGNRSEAEKLSREFIHHGNSIKELYEQIIKPALYEVGRLWEQNKISVASEHLATAITEGVLNSFYSEIIPEKYNGKKVVLACVEREEHQVGIKMVADIFEMNQWESFFLGTGFPTAELVRYTKEINPDIIAISLSVYFNFARLKKMLEELSTQFPNLKIIVGGQAISYLSQDFMAQWNNVAFLSDLNELETLLKNLK